MKAIALMIAAATIGTAHAQTRSVQPYIDNLKKDLDPAPKRESYIDAEKKKLQPQDSYLAPGESYIDYLRRTDPAATEYQPKGSYTEEMQRRIAPRSQESAIAKVKQGRSELRARKQGSISKAFGFRFGASMVRDLLGSEEAEARPFSEIYPSGFTPDLTLFYEVQPWHSEWFGNIGIVLSGGLAVSRGTGLYSTTLNHPTEWNTSGTFGSESATKTRFLSMPISAGLNYRFNLLRIIRPYVQASPTIIGYAERRSDEKDQHRGYSTGLTLQGGIAIQMDFLDKKSSWELYEEAGVHQYYVTIDYTRLTTFSGDVDFNVSGIAVGLAYEF